MMDTLIIPRSHWNDPDSYANRGFVPYWEKALRANVAAQADPAKRFEGWLAAKAAGESTEGVRLIFIEQPYLAWAQAVEQAIEKAEKDLRQLISYEVANPDDD